MRVLEAEHPATFSILKNLGLVLKRQANYEEAEVMHRRALECPQKVLGVEHNPFTVNGVENLGLVLQSKFNCYVGISITYPRSLLHV